MRHSFHQPTRVDEDQRSLVPLGQFHDPVQRLRPQLVARNRPQLRTRHLDSQVDFPRVPGIHYQAVGIPLLIDMSVTDQESRHLFYRPLCRRQPYPRYRALGKHTQPLHRKTQVRPPFVVSHRMNLVDDKRLHPPQSLPSALGRQQDVQRLGCGDQDMRWPLGHALPL